jgi:putative hydrolase of HD superfamily
MKKTGVSTSGVFTIKEYLMDEKTDIPMLIRRLQAGPETIQEVVSYVFEGDDPLQIDARSFSVEEFLKQYPQMQSYGPGLAFDVVIRTEGQPVTVELTQGEPIVCTNSLDKEVELEDLLGMPDGDAAEHEENPEAADSGAAPEQGVPDMTPAELLEILRVAERLKCHTRHCDISSGRRESVAEHSWRAALLAMLLSGVSDFRSFDMNKVIRMCLIHDLGEAFTGDIPTFEKTSEHTDAELTALDQWVGGFPEAQRREFEGLYAEMKAMETPEARLYKAIDKIEAVIQHNESDIATWIPHEYELNLVYGNDKVAFSTYLTALREVVRRETLDKIEAEKK